MKHIPRKRFGQHFLHDDAIIDAIVRAIAPQPGEAMVEIGPGLAALTEPLVERLGRLSVIELDRDLAKRLRADARLTVIESDVLKVDFAQIAQTLATTKLRVVGNLPYNISTPLLFHLIEQREHVLDMHFMLQKEVVDRMAAAPGSDDYGRLTVMLAPWVKVTALFDIGPGAFRPPPRVQSTVVRLTPRAEPLEVGDPRDYSMVVAAAFSQRRKTLRNALKPVLDVERIIAADIDPSLRAEVLAPTDFARLSMQLAAANAEKAQRAAH